MNILSEFVDLHKSQVAAAKALNLNSVQTLNNWKRRGHIPSQHWKQIVELSGGRITYEDFYRESEV